MRTQVIAGKTVLTVTFRYDDDEGDKDVVNFIKLGRRVRVTTSGTANIKQCLTNEKVFPWSQTRYDVDDIEKNIEVGPKTLARVIEDALVYGHSRSDRVDSNYAFEHDHVAFELAGKNRLRFTAPCGRRGFLTRNEATKLVAGLRSL